MLTLAERFAKLSALMLLAMACALIIITGLLVVWVGTVFARRQIQVAQRAYLKLVSYSASKSEGWGPWFVEGFSGIAMGRKGFAAIAMALMWSLAGMCFVSLGIWLFIST